MKQVANIAVYRKSDWDRLVSSAVDKHNLHESWEEWFVAFMSAKANIERQNLTVKEVIVDIDELLDFCKNRGLQNTSKTRSEFVLMK